MKTPVGRRQMLAGYLMFGALLTHAAAALSQSPATEIPASGPATGLADSAALRATVFGTPPQDIASLPEKVPLIEMDLALPGARPVPPIYWFDRRLRVWFSAQKKPAPLAIVIEFRGGKLSRVRTYLEHGEALRAVELPS